MLQRFIQGAKVNVFESARFYNTVLFSISIYFFFNRFIRKLFFIVFDNKLFILKAGEFTLICLAYIALIISAFLLRKKIPAFVFYCWGGIVLLYVINDLYFFFTYAKYDLLYSLFSDRGFYTIKLTFPLLFWGVWGAIENTESYAKGFIVFFERLLVLNALLIFAGFTLKIDLFETYPLSGRWGYSGLFWHSINSISYGIFLMINVFKEKKSWFLIFLISLCLVLLGQKSGLLYLILIFFFVGMKSLLIRFFSVVIAIVAIISHGVWVPKLVLLSPFWKNVFEDNGSLSILLSLRDQNLKNIWLELGSEIKLIDFLIGSFERLKGNPEMTPLRIEMLPFDFLLFYGLAGLILYIIFLNKYIHSWFWATPIIIACFAGGIYEEPVGMLIYGISLSCFGKLNMGSYKVNNC